MELVDKEIKFIWNNGKEKNHEKVNCNIKKRVDKVDVHEGIFNGILVGDTELENYEKIQSGLIYNTFTVLSFNIQEFTNQYARRDLVRII